jgi:hypothetical protein
MPFVRAAPVQQLHARHPALQRRSAVLPPRLPRAVIDGALDGSSMPVYWSSNATPVCCLHDSLGRCRRSTQLPLTHACASMAPRDAPLLWELPLPWSCPGCALKDKRERIEMSGSVRG